MSKGKKWYGYDRSNLVILILSLILIGVGYVLMSGGASESPQDFNPEVFSFRRITLAPIVTFVGYMGVIVAILKR